MKLLKSIMPALLAVTACVAANAQDKIYKRNGDVLEGSVKEVGTRTVSYKRADMPKGPDYLVGKNEVKKIVYSNGVEDVFPRHGDVKRMTAEDVGRRDNMKYGANVLGISPIAVTDNGVGVGLSYERVLDKRGIFSFILPAIFSFNNNASYYNYTTGTYDDRSQNMFYAYPGLKIYPTGAYGVVRYGVGPSLVIATGQKYDEYYYNANYQHNYGNKFIFGVMINNSLNINPTEHVYLSLDFGLGFTYVNQLRGRSQGTDPLVQTGFKIGYRF